jgi:hypothetical protein
VKTRGKVFWDYQNLWKFRMHWTKHPFPASGICEHNHTRKGCLDWLIYRFRAVLGLSVDQS